MKVYTKTLTDQEVTTVVKDGMLDAVLNISLTDIIDSEGIDQFNDLVDTFPDLMLSNISYEVVGYDPPQHNDGDCCSGKLHIRVQAEVDEESY